MARDFNSDWVEIEVNCFGPECSHKSALGPGELQAIVDEFDPRRWKALSGEAAAAAKKRVLDELRKFGLHFNETPGLQVDPASAERTLLALRLQAATPGMTFAEASRQVREKK